MALDWGATRDKEIVGGVMLAEHDGNEGLIGGVDAGRHRGRGWGGEVRVEEVGGVGVQGH